MLDRLFGPSPGEDALAQAWAGFRSTAQLGALSSVLFGGIYLALGAYTAGTITLGAAAVFFALRFVVPPRRVELGLTLVVVVALVGFAGVARDLGGMTSPPVVWMPLLLRSTYSVVGRRVAVVGAGLTAVAVFVIFVTERPPVLPPLTLDIVRGVSVVTALVSALIGAARHERSRERASAVLARARDDAFAASRLKGELVATVSHELRTPLNAIVGMTGILEKSPLDEQQREYTRVVRGAAETLVTLVDDLLETSRLEAGRVGLQAVPFELRALADPVVDMLAPRARAKGLVLALEAPASLPRVVGDAGRLRQVVTNLIDNAVKFTSAGRVDVKIAASPVDAAAPKEGAVRVCITVADTGIGIPPDKLPVIFERFRQADSSMTRRYGGTGLGLAIARDLVTLMGGTLVATSEPGHGSVFTASCVLPRAPAAASLQGTRVLLAEDNAVNQRLAEHLLTSLGCTVDVAHNGSEAVSMAQSGAYDVILMDCHMPEMDGYRAATAIRRAAGSTRVGRAPPILALTAAGSAEDVRRAREAGMDELLQKPIDVEGIRASLGRVVGARAPK